MGDAMPARPPSWPLPTVTMSLPKLPMSTVALGWV